METLNVEEVTPTLLSSKSKKKSGNHDLISTNSINDDEDENIIIIQKEPKKKKYNFPFIFYIFIFTFIIFIASIITLIVLLISYKQFYKFSQDVYTKPHISEHNYSKIEFDNGVEVVLTQVHYDDMAGGALSFEKGYLDLKYEPGFLKLALLSLRLNDRDSIREISDYMGNMSQVVEEFYSTFYFTILNKGFEKFLKRFKNYSTFDENDEADFNRSVRSAFYRFYRYSPSFNSWEEKEKYLVEYLVYDIKNETGNDINRQGTLQDVMERLNDNYDEIKKIMEDLFIPRKTKLIFFSHYKMSLMKKFILRHLHKFVYEQKDRDSNDTLNKNFSILNTNKIIYHQIENNDNNYLKINYYINSTKDNISQLYLDSGYFNYLKYILDETHEDSLYYKLTNTKGINIKSLSCDFEVVLKSKIRFSIFIQLNCYSYEHIKEIIEIVYNYMEKIKSHINNLKSNDDRVRELYYINEQNFSFTEDTHTGEFYKNKAKDLFYRDERNYFLKEVWIPPDLNKNETNINFYIKQLTKENSVIIIGLNEKTKDKYNLNETDIALIFNGLNVTKSLDKTITYSIHEIDELNITINKTNDEEVSEIKYHPNEFISNYSSDYNVPNIAIPNNEKYEPINDTDNLIKFYWIKDTSFKLPKVYAISYYFHPFQRPNFKNDNQSDIMFFHLMLYFSHIQRQIDSVLADAKRAGNTFSMGFVENYLYLNVFAYSDVVENILTIVKERVLSVKNETIKKNYEIYKDYALENLANFENSSLSTILKYEFFKYITNQSSDFPPIYNFMDFKKSKFENYTEMNIDYINNINIPIIYTFIMGFYEKEEAMKLYEIFRNYSSTAHFQSTLLLAEYNDNKIKGDQFVDAVIDKPGLKKTIKIPYPKINDSYSYSFMSFVPFSDYNRIPFEMLSRIMQEDRRGHIYVEVMNQKYVYLRFNFLNIVYNSTEQVKQYIINRIGKIKENITEPIDVLGGRFYHLVKNMEIEYTKNPTDLKSAALEYSYNQVYKRDRTDKAYKIDTNDDYDKFKDIIINLFENYKYYVEYTNPR